MPKDKRRRDLLLVFCATLAPAALIALGANSGGPWPVFAVLYMTALAFAMDRLVPASAREDTEGEGGFPASMPLLVLLWALHFSLLARNSAERILIAIAGALVFGQIAHPVAHELIHKPARAARLLGRMICTNLLAGHHVSAHPRVHHLHVASDGDPNSAPRGEGLYRFVLRAGWGGFVAGPRAETAMLRRADRLILRHPYIRYIIGGVACSLAAWAVGGVLGVAGYVAMCLYAQAQILMSDYVQHYGLCRRTLPDGRPEPVGPQYSWNTPHCFSSALMLSAPRHSDHHVNPG